MESIRGPYNPSINDECGLLVRRFDLPPCSGLTWNPAYYKTLLETAGYTRARMLFGFNLPLHRLPEVTRLARIVKRIGRNPRLKLRTMDLSRLDQELRIVYEIYNSTLERNWGFVPISMEDLLSAADEIRAVANPELLLIAEMNGKEAGVALSLPNFNEILARTKKIPHWFRLPYILWLMKTCRITSARQTVFGIAPSCRDRGLDAWLLYENFACAKRRYANATLGWIEESNTEVLNYCEITGGEPTQAWEILQKSL